MARTGGKRAEPKARVAAETDPPKVTLRPVQQEPKSGLGMKVVIAGAVLVVLAAVVVLSINLANEEERESVASAFLAPDVTVTGSPLPPYSAAVDTDQAVGLIAPEIMSAGFDGTPMSIEHDGTPKLILFLAHWCEHCRREVPVLQDWINTNGVPAGVELVSVATSISEIRPNYPPDVWLERENWTQRTLVDDTFGSIASVYGLSSFPYYVAVSGSGEVLVRLAGEQDPDTVGTVLSLMAAEG